MKGFVLDLRFDPGGLFSQATEIADMFIDGGTIVSTKGRNTPTKTWEAKKEGTFPNFPMAVIINHFTRLGQRNRGRLPAGPPPRDDRRRAKLGQGERAERDRAGKRRQRPQADNRELPSAERQEHSPLPRRQGNGRLGRDARRRLRGAIHARKRPKSTPKPTGRERDVLSKNGPPKSDFKDRQLNKALEAVRSKLSTPSNAAAQKSKPARKGATRRRRTCLPAEKSGRTRPDASALELGVG